jgi:hypothetical protein
MTLAALGTGAGAAAGLGVAAAGAIPLAIGAGIVALTFGLSKISPGENARARAKTAAGIFSNPSLNPMSPGASDVVNGVKGSTPTKISGTDPLKAFLDALNKNTTAVKKNTKTVFEIATENAMKELAARQKALSGSASIAIGAPGSKSFGTRGGTTVVVNNAGSVISNNDLVTSIVNGIERTTRRSFGTVGAFDR